MRIIHVLNEAVDTGNGIVNATVDLACAQVQQGHDVHVLSCGGGSVELLAKHGVTHHTLWLKARPILTLLRDLPRLRSTIRRLKPDIVHAHMMTGAVLAQLGRAFAGFGRFKLVTTVHNEWRATSRLMRLGDRVIILSQSGKRAAIARGFPAHKLCVVSNGVLNSPRTAFDIAPVSIPIAQDRKAPIIVTMAGLYTRKGIGDLIQAFARIADDFPDAVLKIAGWGPERDIFEAMRMRLGCADRIEFLGFVSQTQALLRQADIFVLASHTESFPLALAEARQAGCAVIGTTVGGVPELLENGRAGLLVPPHDPEALARTLRQLLESPEALAAWRRASRFNIGWLSCQRMERETMDVYLSILGGQGDALIAA